MQEIINTILKNNVNLFGSSHKIEKINVGFTNTIYNVNDSFIIKICINTNNEKNFENEINFYNKNKENSFIPKLYYSNTDKKDIPYYYEIIEKVEGVSLYNVWHTFSEEQREEIIKQLCDFMKQMHSNTCDRYDWSKKIKDKFIILFNKTKELNIFNEEEQSLLEHAYSKFDRYLESNDFVLVHNDLHFDNIFYNNGKIIIIDFERSMYAPRDFELNIISKMIRKPWKYASEETEEFTNSSDYSNIMLYIKKYYPELVNIPNLHQRLSIYDMVYYLEQLVKHPEIEELKDDVIRGTKVVALKDELTFNDVKTPNELMDYLDMNIEYGWIDKQGNKHIDNLTGLRENYRTSSIDEILNTGLATCIEDAKIIKFFLDKQKIENKLFCYRTVENEDNFDQKVKMHCFVLFKYDNNWYHFEHSMTPIKGIHKYNSIEEAIAYITSKWEKGERELTEIDSIPDYLSFKEFNKFVNEFDNCKKRIYKGGANMKENNYICTNRTKEYKNRVENIINNSKKEILDFFEFSDDGRFNFNVYIYDTNEELVKGLQTRGFKKDPAYMCACTKDEDHSLNFYEPLDKSDVDWTKDEYDNVIYHELIHGIQYYIYGKQPEWLTEGIAKYLDGMYNEEIIYSHLENTYSNELEYVLKEKIDVDNPLSMNELVNEFNGSISYYHSYLIVSYLIEIEGKSEFIKKIYDNNYIKGLENRDLINESINYYIYKFNTKMK